MSCEPARGREWPSGARRVESTHAPEEPLRGQARNGRLRHAHLLTQRERRSEVARVVNLYLVTRRITNVGPVEVDRLRDPRVRCGRQECRRGGRSGRGRRVRVNRQASCPGHPTAGNRDRDDGLDADGGRKDVEAAGRRTGGDGHAVGNSGNRWVAACNL